MINYIKNILPQLKQFSNRLDQTSIFVDKPWVLIDSDSNTHHYSFQKDGRLIMSLNGNAQIGRWEYINGSESLLIDRNFDKVLLNYLFIENGLMFLKKDGTTDDPWVLINKNVIPDLNYEDYLTKLFINVKKFKAVSFEGKKHYYADNGLGRPHVGDIIYNENFQVIKDGIYRFQNKSITVSDGQFQSQTYNFHFKLEGEAQLDTAQENEYYLSVGDKAIINGDAQYSGTILINPVIFNHIKSIDLQDGTVTSFKEKTTWNTIGAYIVLAILAISVIGAIMLA